VGEEVGGAPWEGAEAGSAVSAVECVARDAGAGVVAVECGVEECGVEECDVEECGGVEECAAAECVVAAEESPGGGGEAPR